MLYAITTAAAQAHAATIDAPTSYSLDLTRQQALKKSNLLTSYEESHNMKHARILS